MQSICVADLHDMAYTTISSARHGYRCNRSTGACMCTYMQGSSLLLNRSDGRCSCLRFIFVLLVFSKVFGSVFWGFVSRNTQHERSAFMSLCRPSAFCNYLSLFCVVFRIVCVVACVSGQLDLYVSLQEALYFEKQYDTRSVSLLKDIILSRNAYFVPCPNLRLFCYSS